MEFSGEKILVVGLGKSGLSAARWLSKNGARVTVSEIKSEAEIEEKWVIEAQGLGITLETGGHRIATFLESELIVVSPGVPLEIEPMRMAQAKDIPIIGELELAARLIDTPLIAVTGTNGKSTTTALLGSMIERAGFKVFMGGNIGTPLMDYAAGNRKADYAVVEVSSFQLDTMETFRPHVSLLLNISPDHLDRYSDYEAYVRSKLRIFQNQGHGQYAVLNDDDERLSKLELSGGISVLRYGMKESENRQAHMSGKKIAVCFPETETHYFDTTRFSLPGTHNLENLMGAVLVGRALQIAPRIIQETIDQFQGLPHRLEHIRCLKDIDFYNDSKATNVDAAAMAIKGFDRPIILIAGGRHKGGDYLPLVQVAKGRVKKVILLGESKDLMAQSFDGIIPFSLAEDMEDAVSQAFSSAMTNDVVLLAPACSSFDMFSDYAHRGNAFKKAVERLHHGG